MRVLLLGPNGQLGTDVRRVHAAADTPVDLIPAGRRQLDVTDAQFEERLAETPFDVLVNCTGYHRTDEAEDNAKLAFAVNAQAVQRMARVCRRRRARFLHISTDYVFGGDTERRSPLREDDPVAPVNVYGASKALGETLARLAWEDVLILRVASLFGVAGSSGKGGNFVETMLRLARERGEVRVVDDQAMSPTGTADVARVMLRMLTEGCDPGIYHVVNSGVATWYEFAREIVRQASVPARITPCTSAEFPTRASRPHYSALDNAGVQARFGLLAPWQEALTCHLDARRRLRSEGGPPV
ncbi:MAG: dTDP-4-dehydrorhamnose reductase [Gammaproteobacteria bacterium]|nr:dTDP-4-dehydrorhamnose reductase [Gammaproteobacteria bacterium]